MQRHPDKRTPYPLSMKEQRLLFSELAPHLARMALFRRGLPIVTAVPCLPAGADGATRSSLRRCC
jgi:hypothetical protein